jgi:hypothetical protein
MEKANGENLMKTRTWLRVPVRFGGAVATSALLLVMAASHASAFDCGNDKPVGNAQDCPTLGTTPELDSLLLFGGGLTGLGGYVLLRLKGRRTRDE